MARAPRERKPKPVDPAITRERRLQELGYPDLSCVICGITEPAVMRKLGMRLVQFDHTDGEAISDLGAFLCVLHHLLKHASRRANEDLFAHIENQSPLLQMAAAEIGRAIFYEQQAQHQRAEAQWLAEVNRGLVQHFGEHWWGKYGIPPFPGRMIPQEGGKS